MSNFWTKFMMRTNRKDRKLEGFRSALPARGSRLASPLLLLFALLLGISSVALAEEKFCSQYGGVVDGNVLMTSPVQVTVDTTCTFQNWPQSKPLTATINFQTNDPTIYLIIFDNVYYTGNMACSNIDHKLWFSNGSYYGSNNACQELFIPIEKIDKQNPVGQTTASIGVPFTYTLTIPVMYDPATGMSGNFPSANDLGNVRVTDDLTATGAALTLLNLNAYYQGTGTPVPVVNLGDNKHLSFVLPDVLKGQQIVVEMTVVLDDTATNVAGTQFVNTAKWLFSRSIDVDEDGVIEPGEFYEPLPGEWGETLPMTIVEPNLVVSKTSVATALNVGDTATFSIDVENSGGGDAWNATILDQLPAGMCGTDPRSTLSAEIVAAGGIPGSGLSLTPSDYTATYSGCQLSLTMLTAAAKIAPEQHLLITYQTQLDNTFTNDGATLTNVAGATQWFTAGNPSGRTFSRTLTDGTPAVVDHQDSQTVTAALHGYYFEKTVANLTSQASPATTAAPGDRLRYTLRLFNVDQAINGISISDTLDPSRFDLTSFGNVTLPAGATHTFNAATGQLLISGSPAPLNITLGGELVFAFDITLKPTLSNGTTVLNQASLAAAANFTGRSDDPYTNGVASPDVVGDEDPTTVLIQTPGPLAKANTQPSATIGEHFTYRITVPAIPTAVPLYDVRILDNLNFSAAELRLVSARVVAGASLSNTSGSDTNLVLEDTITGIDIPANSQAIIEITVELLNTPTNRRGLAFNNSATYTYNRVNGVDSTQMAGGAGGSVNMTVVEPAVAASKTVRFVAPAGKPTTDPAMVGNVLEYTVTIPNSGDAAAFSSNIVDTLPASVTLLPDSATAQVNGVAVTGFVPNPSILPSAVLVWGRQNGDDSLDIPAGQSLVLTYQVTVVAVTGADIINRVYVDWTSLPSADAGERTGAGCPAADSLNDYCFGPATAPLSTVDNTFISKTVVGDSYSETPASTAAPIVRVGDTVTFELTLHLQEYTTQSVVVEDALPAGMALESFAIDAGPNFSYTLSAPPAAGATGTLRWQFGDISNPPSNNATLLDPLVIRYSARLVSDAPPAGVAYDPTLLRDNRATLTYAGGDPALFPARLTAAARVEIRQPQMRAIRKVDRGTGRVGTGTLADPYRVKIAGEVMNFQLSSCNDGLAPAYNVVLSDLLAPELDQSDLTVNPPLVKIGATTLVAGTGYTYTAPGRGGEMQIALQDSFPVNPGECVTVDYNLGFHTDLTLSKSWSNEARLAAYRSLPLSASGRLYPATAPAQVWMTNLVSVDQLLVTLLSPAEATIGEEVIYQIRVPAVPMNAALANVVVTDNLHAALEYLGATAVDAGGSPVTLSDSVAPGQVQLAMANIPAGEQAIITLRTRVANNGQANAGTTFANSAAYTYSGMPADAVTASSSGPLTVVEPLLTVTRTASTLAPQAGEVLTATLNLTAAGAGVGDDFANAFDLSIEESLGLGLAYLPGSATVNGAPLADPLNNGADGISAAQILTWDPANGIDIDVTEGATASVTYQVRVLAGARPGQSLSSSVIAHWTGLNGARGPIERTGSGAPVFNDYFTLPAALTLTTPLAVSFAKSVVNATSGENSGANARPGDTLHYTLVLRNDSMVAVTGATLVDALAAAFAPGSLQVLSVSDPNATNNSNASGGVNATGMVDIRNLTLAAQGESNDTLTIEFLATLAPVLPNGTIVLNRAQLTATHLPAAISNETSTLISSAPRLQVLKTSQDLTGDTNVLRAGDTLRYTITVENVGNEDATGVTLRDLIPAFTTYRANSTTLNGAVVADPAAGRSALHSGLLIKSPADTTAGGMRADADAANLSNIATVTFDVVINSDVVDATLIINQGFVSGAGAGSGSFADQPSDDPATPTPDDPTRDIVGSLPLLDATKTVTLIDQGTAVNSVDPGDELLYTITVSNFGAIAATGVTLTDAVPAQTAYVANSTQLNSVPIPDPSAGVSALQNGLSLQAAGSASGIIPAGATVTLTFSVRIDAVNVSAGDVISNQGYLASSELPTEATDADGNDANGDQPTTVLVGSAQQLAIVKEVVVVGGGVAQAGGQLEYVVRVSNNGVVTATDVLIRDDLTQLAGLASYIAGSATLGGVANPIAVTYAPPLLTASVGDLPPGGVATLRFRVQINADVPIATLLTNTARALWNTPQVISPLASASIEIGGIPGSAMLNGHLWHDANFDNLPAAGETNLAGWTVTLYRNNVALGSVRTDAAGLYHFSGLPPGVTIADQYELHFTAAGAGVNTAKLGTAHSEFTNGLQRISGIVATSGSNLQNLNLPISPNGVIYDSVVRRAVVGARVVLLNAATNTPLPAACFADPVQQNQVTLATGYYKFDLNFSDPSCPPGSAYRLEVLPPATGYVANPSRIIPPANEQTAAPFSVPGCLVSPYDAVPGTAGYCEVVPSPVLPPLAIAARTPGTSYYLSLTLSNGLLPGESQLFNNHIPVDPELAGAVAISKISPLRNVSKGQLVPYTITVTNVFGVPLADLGIVDRVPAGFKYVAGSARLDGQPREPRGNGRELLWDGIDLQFNAKRVLQLLLVVSSGVSEGEYVNRAQVVSTASGGAASGEATATVRVTPDPTFDCTDVVGKVFDDRNLDGEQDADEAGLAGVRVVSARGLIATSDEHGRFHIACAVVPDELRGSNFILKLDDRSLPSGYRLTSENPLVQRATRGKMLRYNFGATIHRVVAIDIAAGVFEPERTALRLQWIYKLPQLLAELKKAPAILRLSYLADIEDAGLVEARLEALKQEIVKQWTLSAGGYRLQIETEVFWRRGGPP